MTPAPPATHTIARQEYQLLFQLYLAVGGPSPTRPFELKADLNTFYEAQRAEAMGFGLRTS